MNFLKKNFKWIITIIVSIIIASGISVYATNTYLASQVTYKEGKTVKQALDELYTNKKSIEKQSLGNFTFTFSSCGSSENYKNYTDTKVISIAEIFPYNYKDFSENNFSYQITSVKTKTADSNSNWCYGSNFSSSPILTYDNESGNLSLTINIQNGYHDYISEVKVNVYSFK